MQNYLLPQLLETDPLPRSEGITISSRLLARLHRKLPRTNTDYSQRHVLVGNRTNMGRYSYRTERVLLQVKDKDGITKDNVSIINGSDLTPILNKADIGLKPILRAEVEVSHGPDKELKKTEVVLPIAEISTSLAVDTMVSTGQLVTSVEGLQVQNGLTSLHQTHIKAATGEEVPQAVLLTNRLQYQLPEDAVVYCNFNQLYKIDPATLTMWCKILHLVPKSVLWLLRFPAHGEQNVIKYCVEQGIHASRIIFSNVAAKEEHVRRGQMADVCLDTPLCNGHTTGMDILFTGTPMVTLPLDTLASRVASSQLDAIGIPELVANDRDQYVNIAAKLGNDHEYLVNMRAKVWTARMTSTLFDVKQYCTDMENLFYTMWTNYENNIQIDHIFEPTVTPKDG